MIKRYLVTGDGFDLFTDDLAAAQQCVRRLGGAIYERIQEERRPDPAMTEPRSSELCGITLSLRVPDA